MMNGWKPLTYFRKTLHLRCLTGFWIHLCSVQHTSQLSSTFIYNFDHVFAYWEGTKQCKWHHVDDFLVKCIIIWQITLKILLWTCSYLKSFSYLLKQVNLFKITYKNNRLLNRMWPKLTEHKYSRRTRRCSSGIFIVNFDHNQYNNMVFLLLTLNSWLWKLTFCDTRYNKTVTLNNEKHTILYIANNYVTNYFNNFFYTYFLIQLIFA